MEKMKVLVAEDVAEAGIRVLQQELDVDVKMGLPREELLKIIDQYDALVVRSVVKVNEELLSKATRLKVVGRAGNGIDNIDIAAATRHGVIVANTPDSNTISACEHTIGLLISSCRNIPLANNTLKSGVFQRSRFNGTELYGKTIGIVGLGRIGSMVAVRMRAFGMKVIAYDPYISDERFKRFGAEKMETLNDLVARADVITVHTPKTEETFGMIGEEQFKIAKKGVRVVNCARGGIINEAALEKALAEGIVASAAIDVFTKEPLHEHPLFAFDNVVVTPHLGASTVEAQNRVGINIAEQVINALKGEVVPNAVNLPTLIDDELVILKPYIHLAEKLGKLYFQLEKAPVEQVEMTYSGELADKEVRMLTLAFLKGLLEPVLQERVNYVNAHLVAENRGIKVFEDTEERMAKGYANVVMAKIKTAKGNLIIAGTVSPNGEPRLIELYGYETDVCLTEYMLIVENIDRPGVIGSFATILGEENVNIAAMQVGRRAKGQTALMTLSVDNEVSEKALSKLRTVTGILSAKFVRL